MILVFIWILFKKCKNLLRTQPFPKCLISPFPSDLCRGQPFWPGPAQGSCCPLYPDGQGWSVSSLPLTQQSSHYSTCPLHNRYGAQVQLNSDAWALGEEGGQMATGLCQGPLQALTRLRSAVPHCSSDAVGACRPSLTSPRKPP